MEFSKIAACLTVRFNASKGWKQSATDKQASKQSADNNSCERSACKVVVKLFENETTRAINSLFTDTRKQLQRFTLPTESESVYLLPVGNFELVNDTLRDAQQKLASMLIDLRSRYDSYLSAEQNRLGGLFDSRQYPSVSDVVELTQLKFRFAPLPDASRFAELIDVDSLANSLRAELESEYTAQQAASESELLARLQDAVLYACGIVERYHNENGKRLAAESAVETIRERAVDVARLNYTGSHLISSACDGLTIATKIEPEELKDKFRAEQLCYAWRLVVKLPVGAPPVAQPVAPPVAQPVAPLVAQPVAPPVAQPVAQPVVAAQPIVIENAKQAIQAAMPEIQAVAAAGAALLANFSVDSFEL